MEILIISFAGFAFWLIVSAINARTEMVTLFDRARESLCANCVYAHIARGYTNESLMYCTYAGVSREVKFVVSECSMFCNRNAEMQIVRVIGFADTVDQSISPSVAAKARSG